MQVLILGMHRSGTSALARVVHGLGIGLGDLARVETDGAEENPHGFWEHQDVRNLNEALLVDLGYNWDLIDGFSVDAIPRSRLARFSAAATEIVSALDREPTWAIKDPRLSLLLPCWLPLLDDPVFVYALRHPLHVAVSLQTRNDFPLDVGLALWEAYNLAALRAMRPGRVIPVHYETLVEQPAATIAALGERLQAYSNVPLVFDAARLDALVDPDLNRSVATFETGGKHPALRLHARLLQGLDAFVGQPARLSPESEQALRRHQKAFRRTVFRLSRQLDGGDALDVSAYPAKLLPRARREWLDEQLAGYRSASHQLGTAASLAQRQVRQQQLELADLQDRTRRLARDRDGADQLFAAVRDIVNRAGAELEATPELARSGELSGFERAGVVATDVSRNLRAEQERLVDEAAALTAASSALVQMVQPDAVAGGDASALRGGALARAANIALDALRARRMQIDAVLLDAQESTARTPANAGSGLAQTLQDVAHQVAALHTALKNARTDADAARADAAALRALHAAEDARRDERVAAQAQSALAEAKARIVSLERDLGAEKRKLVALDASRSELRAQLRKLGSAWTSHRASWRWRLGDRVVRTIEMLLLRGKQRLASDVIDELLADQSGGAAQRSMPAAYTPTNVELPSARARTSLVERTVATAAAPAATSAPPRPRQDEAPIDASALTAEGILAALQTRRYRGWEDENNRRAAAGEGRPFAAAREPLVLIGTLYSGEGEYDACRAAIERQSYRNVRLLRIEHMAAKPAHAKLYTTFLKGDAELLIKIDADMVIVDEHFVQRVVDVYLADPDVGMIQMAILDYYSGGEIQGVNAYTRKMQWEANLQDGLFTDSTQTPIDLRRVIWPTFGRSVVHSPNPTPFQAFHFGVHRGSKVAAAARAGKRPRALEQLMYLERCHEHYQLRRDPRLAHACLGAELALRGKVGEEHIDYTTDALNPFFAPLEHLSRDELRRTLEQRRAEPFDEACVGELLADREVLLRRPRVDSMLLLLPHLKVFGGVNRFLEIARHARRQGIDAVVAVPERLESELARLEQDFPDVVVLTLEEALERHWSVALCGDYSSSLMGVLPWFQTDLSAIYLLNGWQHKYLNDVQIRLAMPDVVLANSSYVAECYRAWAPALVPGAVDLEVFSPPLQRAAPDGVTRIAVPCGRRKARKRLDDAIAACARAMAAGVNVELHLFDAQPIAIDTGVPTVIHSGLSRRDVAALFGRMDIVLCPEEDAGWNNPAAEAMACGVPVICTVAGTMDFAIDGETALVAAERDVDGFAAAIVRLARDPHLAERLATQARARIAAFSWPALTRRLIDVLESSRPDRARRADSNTLARKRVVNELRGGTS